MSSPERILRIGIVPEMNLSPISIRVAIPARIAIALAMFRAQSDIVLVAIHALPVSGAELVLDAMAGMALSFQMFPRAQWKPCFLMVESGCAAPISLVVAAGAIVRQISSVHVVFSMASRALRANPGGERDGAHRNICMAFRALHMRVPFAELVPCFVVIECCRVKRYDLCVRAIVVGVTLTAGLLHHIAMKTTVMNVRLDVVMTRQAQRGLCLPIKALMARPALPFPFLVSPNHLPRHCQELSRRAPIRKRPCQHHRQNCQRRQNTRTNHNVPNTGRALVHMNSHDMHQAGDDK